MVGVSMRWDWGCCSKPEVVLRCLARLAYLLEFVLLFFVGVASTFWSFLETGAFVAPR